MGTEHKIIHGDCLEELQKLPDESVDLIFADPPYGLAKKKGLGWKYSKHVTLQKHGIYLVKMNFLNLILNGLLNVGVS